MLRRHHTEDAWLQTAVYYGRRIGWLAFQEMSFIPSPTLTLAVCICNVPQADLHKAQTTWILHIHPLLMHKYSPSIDPTHCQYNSI